jgi:hypothetical protein
MKDLATPAAFVRTMPRVAVVAALVLAACKGPSSTPTVDKSESLSKANQTDVATAHRDAAAPHSAYFKKMSAYRDRMCACRDKPCVEKLDAELANITSLDAESSLPDEQEPLLEVSKQLMACEQNVAGAH